MRVAFYKGPSRLFGRLIRWWTSSAYSHVELVFSDGCWFSSSEWDGGVRFSYDIDGNPEKWDFYELDCDEECEKKLRNYCMTFIGQQYDWVAILFCQILQIKHNRRNRWFCSEIVLKCLQRIGIGKYRPPELTSPGQLHEIIQDFTSSD